MKQTRALAAAMLAGGLCGTVHAQPYSVKSFSIDGGGGTAGSGGVSLSGTVGQPDAGTVSAGPFALFGGFWNGLPACPADFNRSGTVTVQDIFDFLAAWFAANPAADFNHSGAITVQDIFDFLAAWFAGCP